MGVLVFSTPLSLHSPMQIRISGNPTALWKDKIRSGYQMELLFPLLLEEWEQKDEILRTDWVPDEDEVGCRFGDWRVDGNQVGMVR